MAGGKKEESQRQQKKQERKSQHCWFILENNAYNMNIYFKNPGNLKQAKKFNLKLKTFYCTGLHF